MKNHRNTYEESPERLKDLVKNSADMKGQRSPSKPTRSGLLREHERHLKMLTDGSLPVKNMLLPLPYPPSRVSLKDSRCRKIRLEDLRIDCRDPSNIIVLRTIASPYIYSSTITAAEDEMGHVARLTVCNLEDTMVDPIIPESSILAIKQPCWSILVDGGVHIRVDHPSDLVILDGDEGTVPETWQKEVKCEEDKSTKEWKREGDMCFLKKRFRRALVCYNNGLHALDDSPSTNTATAIDLHRKKCGVNIVLLRLDDAAKDLAEAISLSNSSFQPSAVEEWLHNGSIDDPLQISPSIPKPLLELSSRIKFDLGIYQSAPHYDLPLLTNYVGPLSLHLDAPNYICDTEIRQTANHGRGVFSKKEFKAGELIAVEKAFVLPGYFIQDRGSDCLLYNLGNETAAQRPGALLFRELVQKLRWNGSLRGQFFELDAGDYDKDYSVGEKNGHAEDGVVDVFQIEAIRQRNCFSVPTRSIDLLNEQYNRHQEMRNGFWNHASYINHSCIPNSVRTFIGDIHLLRATRDIKAGEEITHQYISPEVDILERQEKYMGTWGFECDCPLCAADGCISKEARDQRLALFNELKAAVMRTGGQGPPTITAIKRIAKMTARLESLYPEDIYTNLPRLALVHPTLFLVEAWRGVRNTDKTIEFAFKLLRNFGIIAKVQSRKLEIEQQAGLINVESMRCLIYLKEGYESKGEGKLAEECLEVAKRWYGVVTGVSVGWEEFLRSV
ncbi:hypothetical protein K469DRAFT_740787 [Zopfia rhizophila CBS 207.26]|uniref:SET domain-containing protein n=1 Tax=Zopfia rhizophila CBS 207.26 TaxID=1314779 RepID=A0A6A6DRQ3_9PEZI|nr:hypothetical protein K469DRAFT_740787 [Zopfia rhizophila CBS 207.26]